MKIIIRFGTLFLGFAFALYIIFINFESSELLLMQFAMMFLWVLLPFYGYFLLSMKSESIFYILVPPLSILIPYALFAYDYLTSESSTSALVFIVAPVFGIASMGLGYLIAWVFTKLFKKKTI
jgi:hypothetical protein